MGEAAEVVGLKVGERRGGGAGQRVTTKRRNSKEAADVFLASLGCEKPKVAANMSKQPAGWLASMDAESLMWSVRARRCC